MTDQTAEEALAELLEQNPELAALNPDLRLLDGPETEEDLPWANPSPVQAETEKRKQAYKAGPDRPAVPLPSRERAFRQHPEQDFQGAVIDLLHVHHWHVAAVRHARTLKGWRTPWEADGKGMKDLIAVKDRVIWTELKAPGGVVSPEQKAWHDWLLAAGQESYIWYPKDWETILKVVSLGR